MEQIIAIVTTRSVSYFRFVSDYRNLKLGIVVVFKILIQNFQGVTILGHVIDDVSSLDEWIFCLQNRSYYIPLERHFYADQYLQKNHTWKPTTFELKSFKYYPLKSSLCGKIGQVSDMLCVIYHWKQNLTLINLYSRTMPFKLQIWELQTFKCYVLKSLFLFEVIVFCLSVGIEEHLREKNFHLKSK